ncbi:unnamed protein product [Lactuca saligna]|uniref:Uncharacterized protein n=1 Tax=Lactuca saligna TaxID=75948 RepID=A0AA35ZDA7_LACSI|nr:unnamed protein product [Lactuca saligna]
MSAPPPSPDSLNFCEDINCNVFQSIFYDCGQKISENQTEMKWLKKQLGHDYIVCRIDHISLQHKLDGHDQKFKVVGVSMGGIMVGILLLLVIVLHFVLKFG